MNKRIMLIAVTLLAFPASAGAQTGAGAAGQAVVEGSGSAARAEGGAALSVMQHRGEQTSVPASGADAVLEAAIRSGLPEAPLRRVITQGRARGASAAEIERAAIVVGARLEASARALIGGARGRAASAAEIEAGAEALARGARTTEIEGLRDAAPSGRSLVVPLTVLAELGASGAGRAELAADLAARVRAGASDATLYRIARDASPAEVLPGGSRPVGGGADAVIRAGVGGLGISGAASGSVGIGGLR